MDKKEPILFAVTLISFIGFIFILFSIFSSSPSSYSANFNSLTGNVVLNLNNFKVGDKLTGDIQIEDSGEYGILLLSKDGDELFAETFHLGDFSEGGLIKLENLVDYEFGEVGEYELFFSVLKSDINLRRKFTVE